MMPEETPSPFDLLLAKYRLATTEKEKAHLEQSLWEVIPLEERSKLQRRKWLAGVTKDTQGTVENRSYLFGDPQAFLLWDRIEKESMPLTTARERLREAYDLSSKSGMPLQEAIASRLKEYDSWPSHRTKRGQPFRKRPPTRFKNMSEVEKPLKVLHLSETDRGFWSSMRNQLSKFAASRFKGADPIIAERLYREFERDLKVLFDEFQSRLSRYRQQEKRDRRTNVTIKYTHVVNACLALCMDPPSRNQPADLAMARSKKKKLARLYHPDVTGGDEGTRAKYEETLSAYSVLEDYNDQLKQVDDL